MIDIQAPEKIKRGEVLKGKVVIELEKEIKTRGVSISFDNTLSYPNPCTKNFSRWKLSNLHRIPDSMLRNAIIPFEFNVQEESPPAYQGSSLVSIWKINVKIDIPLAFDIHVEKIVEVER